MRRRYSGPGGHQRNGRPADVRGGARGSSERGNYTSDYDVTVVRQETRRYRCPACSRNALDFTHRPHRDGGWTVLVHCFGCGGGLNEIHDATGIPKYRLLTWPPPDALGQPTNRRGRAVGDEPKLPSIGAVGGWHSRLLSERDVMGWLTERGLWKATIERHQLGYDGRAVVIPVYEAGELVNVKRRYWPEPWYCKADGEPVWKRTLTDAGSQLYPSVSERGQLVLVAGELDALIGRQCRLRTVSTTCGATLPEHLVPALAGRSVAVMYDVGEEVAAEKTVATLRAAGSEAWLVRLALLGLPEKADLNDAILGGYTAEDIRKLVRHERGRSADEELLRRTRRYSRRGVA